MHEVLYLALSASLSDIARPFASDANLKQPKALAMLSTMLLFVLILFLIGSLPAPSDRRSWGYAPTGGVGLIILIVVVLLLMGRISPNDAHLPLRL
jgi:hypothetical protein